MKKFVLLVALLVALTLTFLVTPQTYAASKGILPSHSVSHTVSPDVGNRTACWLPHDIEIDNSDQLCFWGEGDTYVDIYNVHEVKIDSYTGGSLAFICDGQLHLIYDWVGHCNHLTYFSYHSS